MSKNLNYSDEINEKGSRPRNEMNLAWFGELAKEEMKNSMQ